MYKFTYVFNSDINNGKIEYNNLENSFDFLPVSNCDIYILINYLNLSFSSDMMEAKSVWGFSPKNGWKNQELKIPKSRKGKIKLEGDYEPGMSYRYNNKYFEEFFDSELNLYCVGNFKIEEDDMCIEFATNIIATITKNGELKNIYIILK